MTLDATPDYSPEIHRRLRSMAKTAASYFHGLEADEFYSIAWLAFHESKLQCKSDTLSFSRAEFSIKDAMRDWIGHDPGQVVEDGVAGEMALHNYPSPEPVIHRTRTKLPRAVKRALAALPDKQRRVLYRTIVWNRTLPELVEEMNIPRNTAATSRHRAIHNLRRMLTSMDESALRVQNTSN